MLRISEGKQKVLVKINYSFKLNFFSSKKKINSEKKMQEQIEFLILRSKETSLFWNLHILFHH